VPAFRTDLPTGFSTALVDIADALPGLLSSLFAPGASTYFDTVETNPMASGDAALPALRDNSGLCRLIGVRAKP
jgi:hypothetical protein